MATPTILSLAILKVNWDKLKRDYLENFVPIVAECIRVSPDDVVSTPALQISLQCQFGLKLPQNVITTILGRVKRHGYIKLENRIYTRNVENFSRFEFHKLQQEVIHKHETIIRNLIVYCAEKFRINWSNDDAETALQSYLEENQLLVIGASSNGTPISNTKHPIRSTKFIVGAFVQHIQETHSSDFDYFETIVKGNMLASAIFLPDSGQTLRKFRKTEVYFDTAFLIFALGYAGEARKDPCVELLNLLYETGADLRCFRHTIEEIRGALDACANKLTQSQVKGAITPSIEYFLSKGYTASDIELFSAQLERNLDALRIRVVEKPPYIRDYLIDEKGLSETLNNGINYHNEQALNRDVDSISAIIRLRRGQKFFFIEECRALFVTTNWSLAKESRKFIYPEGSLSVVSPVITDLALTNLLWLKKPVEAPDLPKKRIIADCYAATQPDERLWMLYLTEIDKLEKSGKVTADDCYLLRYSFEAKSTLMQLTLGEETAFTQGTVSEVLELLRSQIQENLKSNLETETKRREEAEKEVEATKVRNEERILRIRSRAQRYAKMSMKIVTYFSLILLLIGTISTFPWEFPTIANSWWQFVVSTIQAALLFLSVGNLMYGTTVVNYIRKSEIFLSKWFNSKLHKLLD